MKTINIRGRLNKFQDGLKNKSLKIGFTGGSITTASNPENWPTHLCGRLICEFPNVHFRFNNAAISATGSMCGLALAQKEFIDSGYDLVFVEYAVNDHSVDSEERMRTREGLIRKLLSAGIDIVLVYTYFSEMFDRENLDKVPESIEDFEMLARHYQISSVYMAQPVFEMVKNGNLAWHMWLPDGTHPGSLGSYLYSEQVFRFLKEEILYNLEKSFEKKKTLIEPVNKYNWENLKEISFDDVKTTGAWYTEKERCLPWFDEKLCTCAMNASMSFSFFGRGIAFIFNYGKKSGMIEYRIDGGEWNEYSFERYWWVPEENFVNGVKFADDLTLDEHNFELRISYINKKDFTSCVCNILKIFTF